MAAEADGPFPAEVKPLEAWEEDAPTLTEAIRADVEALLAERFGERFTVDGYEVLGARVSTVARITATPVAASGAARTFVVKHVPAAAYADPSRPRRQEFVEEMAAYAFLDSLTPPFEERPARYGFLPGKLLLMEDLGASMNKARPRPEEIVAPLATLFARLHTATFGKGAAYRAERVRQGWQEGTLDTRFEGAETRRKQFEIGARMLGQWSETVGLAGQGEVEALLAPVPKALEVEGPLHAFIHDDLVGARQVVLREGRMRMFDFENARWGVALLDVARVLIGKLERRSPTRELVLVWPGMPPAFVGEYRRALAREGAPAFDEGVWSAAVADAVLFATTCQVGMLRAFMESERVVGALLPNLGLLLGRMAGALEGNPARREVREVLNALRGRIAFGR